MRVLLDSQFFIWTLFEPHRVPSGLFERLLGANVVYLSMATEWELTIKQTQGKLHLPKPIDELVDGELENTSLEFLPIRRPHLKRLAQLPLYHRDPFDRLLIAQALEQDLTVVTSDRIFARYGVKSLPIR